MTVREAEERFVKHGREWRGAVCTCQHIVCVCAVRDQHAETCPYRTAVIGSVGIACDHGRDVCPKCDSCDCGGATGAVWGPPGDETSPYRYRLHRRWKSSLPMWCWCGLNPSTADATRNDPTITREIGFTRDAGAGGLYMVNAHAWRSTDPAGLAKAADPTGPGNDSAILEAALLAKASGGIVIAAWGAHPAAVERGAAVIRMLESAGVNLHVLALTKVGAPAHPLRLPSRLRPVPWERA